MSRGYSGPQVTQLVEQWRPGGSVLFTAVSSPQQPGVQVRPVADVSNQEGAKRTDTCSDFVHFVTPNSFSKSAHIS